MTEPGSWQSLREEFLAAVEELNDAARPAAWLGVWRVLVCHAWVQQRLDRIAAHLLARSRLPADLQPDLVHDALLLVATHVQRTPDLHFDRTRPVECFPGWMGTILDHNCRQAARGLRRYYFRTSPLPATDLVATGSRRSKRDTALREAIDELPVPLNSLLQLYLKGHSLPEIARLLRMSDLRVQRMFDRAIKLLE